MSNYATNAGSGGTTFQSDTESALSADVPGVKLFVGAAGSAQRLLAGSQTAANSLSTALASDQLTAKGTQGASAMPVQNLHDAGRTYVTLYLDAIAGITTEALATMNINVGGTVTTGTSWTVPTGKTFRLQAFQATVKASSTTAVAGRVRVRSAATVAATSGIVAALDIPILTGTAAAGTGQTEGYQISEGLEIAAGQQVGISHIEGSTSSTVSAIVTGYYY